MSQQFSRYSPSRSRILSGRERRTRGPAYHVGFRVSRRDIRRDGMYRENLLKSQLNLLTNSLFSLTSPETHRLQVL
jgi:hypothetical protein